MEGQANQTETPETGTPAAAASATALDPVVVLERLTDEQIRAAQSPAPAESATTTAPSTVTTTTQPVVVLERMTTGQIEDAQNRLRAIAQNVEANQTDDSDSDEEVGGGQAQMQRPTAAAQSPAANPARPVPIRMPRRRRIQHPWVRPHTRTTHEQHRIEMKTLNFLEGLYYQSYIKNNVTAVMDAANRQSQSIQPTQLHQLLQRQFEDPNRGGENWYRTVVAQGSLFATKWDYDLANRAIYDWQYYQTGPFDLNKCYLCYTNAQVSATIVSEDNPRTREGRRYHIRSHFQGGR